MNEGRNRDRVAYWATMILLVLLLIWVRLGTDQFMPIALPALPVAFGAFSIWVIVRNVNRRDPTTVPTLARIWLLSFAVCCGGMTFAYWALNFGFPASLLLPDLKWKFLRTAEHGIAVGLPGAVFVGVCASAISHRRSLAVAVVIAGSTIYLGVIAAIYIDWMLRAG